jgi:hypothetical protein
VYKRYPNGETRVVHVTGRSHDLHPIGPGTMNIVDLKDEFVANEEGTLRLKLGASFLHRYVAEHGRQWLTATSPGDGKLNNVSMDRVMGKGRIHIPIGKIIRSRERSEGEPDMISFNDYLLFIDSQFRQPTLVRLLGLGIAYHGGDPIHVLWVQGDNSGKSIHRGRAEAFYPAETVPCNTCAETGQLSTEGKRLLGAITAEGAERECVHCNGFGRVARFRPAPMNPRSFSERPLHFAAANPTKWR